MHGTTVKKNVTAISVGGKRRKYGLIGKGARYVLWVLDFV